MSKPIWRPAAARVAASSLTRFAERHGFAPPDYAALWRWSVKRPAEFWTSVWDFCGVICHDPPTAPLQQHGSPWAISWFPGAKLNYAENLLRSFGADEAPALIACDDSGQRQEISRAELRTRVAAVAAGLAADGVGVGDRVAGFLPNGSDAVIAMLAATSLGAIWTSCSPDFGEAAVLERFGQVGPKVLFACDGYRYAGKVIDLSERIGSIAAKLSGLQRLVVVPVLQAQPTLPPIAKAVSIRDYGDPGAALRFTPLPFAAPLYVMYSSGTTGKPKCIVHGVGGSLLQQLKEHTLQGDLRQDDRLLYFTTCGWMMWNWQVSALACGATLVLYDGSPFHGGPQVLWQIAERERVSHFGASPKYYSAIEKAGYAPKDSLALAALRTVYSTGSPLAPEQFDFIYAAVKPDVQLASISGGTDIISCLALGNPWSPVYRGELQGPGLGMAVDVYDDDGRPLQGAAGELVCTRPIPSAPVGFWNDAAGEKYRAAYFERFPDVWHHGDFAEWTGHGGLIISGRSDATLNPGGVRIGTAEIYHIVDALPEVLESVAVGYCRQGRHGDEQVILFVRLSDGVAWSAELGERLRQAIRSQLSVRHVPARIIPCPEVPRTRSGKITELAVRALIHGQSVKNEEALANPSALEFFRSLPADALP
ncbi:MAG: acetoacetate--CoA ligase [Nevskiales bacterium]